MLHGWTWSSPWWWDHSEPGTPATLQSPREETWWLWWPQRKCQQTSSFPSGRDRSGSEPPVLQASHGSPTYVRTGTHTNGMDKSIEDRHIYIKNTTDTYVCTQCTYICAYNSAYIYTYVYTYACQGMCTSSYVRTYVCIWLTQHGLEQLREVYVHVYWHNMTCTAQ